MTRHRLFGDFASRYDLHTPAGHYAHDHAFLIELAQSIRPNASVLDVGCGTGVFVDKATSAGLDAQGFDASPAMVEEAVRRVGQSRAYVARMEELEEVDRFDLVCSLSWSLNYLSTDELLARVIGRIVRATRPGGMVVLQVAHAPNAMGRVLIDRESDGESGEVTFVYRFTAVDATTVMADYVYACEARDELLVESHTLRAANAHAVAKACEAQGLTQVRVVDSWRCDPLDRSVAPFVMGRRPA